MRDIYCRECGDLMFIDAVGVSFHGTPDAIDYEVNANHVAVAEEE